MLLADDGRVWQPPRQLRALWTRLRLAVLHAIWVAACHAHQDRIPSTARSVATRVMSYCRQLMLQHWFRVGMTRPDLDACPHWLLARNPALTSQTFQEWWCASEVLCRVLPVAGEGPSRMEVLWDVDAPIPLPAANQPEAAIHFGHGDVDLGEAADMDLDTYD